MPSLLIKIREISSLKWKTVRFLPLGLAMPRLQRAGTSPRSCGILHGPGPSGDDVPQCTDTLRYACTLRDSFFSVFFTFLLVFFYLFWAIFLVFIIWVVFKNNFLKLFFNLNIFYQKKEQFLKLNNFQKIQIITIFKYEYLTKYEPFLNLNIFQIQTFFWKSRIWLIVNRNGTKIRVNRK